MGNSKYVTLNPEDLTVAEIHGILLTAVAPRPIALASTIDREGHVNLSPFSFFNVFSANPPVMVFSPSRRGRDNTTKHTYENLLEVPEVVINIVNFPIVEQVSLSSTEYKKGVNEFIKSGLTAIPSDKIQPPRVAESPVAFECLVDDIIKLGDQGGAGNLVLSRVVKIHIDESYLGDDGKLDTVKLDLVGRMGAMYYTRATGDALIKIPKPSSTKGIGVDALPSHVISSTVLTGNDIGRLGNLASKPTKEEIGKFLINHPFAGMIKEKSHHKIHRLAKQLIEEGHTEKALALLWTIA